MKYSNIVLGLLVISSAMYADMLNEFIVKKTITIESQLEPTLMETKLFLESNSKNYQEVLNVFESTTKNMKTILNDNKGLNCTGGQIRISPVFNYNKSNKEFDTYLGKLSYKCSFTNINDYNKLLTNVEKYNNTNINKETNKNNSKEFINLDVIKWIVSKQDIEKRIQEMEKELINKTKEAEKEYGKEFNHKCRLNDYQLINNQNISFDNGMEATSLRSTKMMTVAEPLKQNTNISLSTNITLKCD